MINCERGVEDSLSKLGRHGGFWGSNQSCVECEKVERGLALKAVWISNRGLWVGGVLACWKGVSTHAISPQCLKLRQKDYIKGEIGRQIIKEFE